MSPAIGMFVCGVALGSLLTFIGQGVWFLWATRPRPTSLDRSWQRAKGGDL